MLLETSIKIRYLGIRRDNHIIFSQNLEQHLSDIRLGDLTNDQ